LLQNNTLLLCPPLIHDIPSLLGNIFINVFLIAFAIIKDKVDVGIVVIIIILVAVAVAVTVGVGIVVVIANTLKPVKSHLPPHIL
jgi:hypothetical protein